MELIDVVRKLNGKIDPVGESNEDNLRFDNLEMLCTLVDKLLDDIARVAQQKERWEASIKRAGTYAHKFLLDTKDQLPDY